MLLLALTLAHADIPPPDGESCAGLEAGKPCDLGGTKGVCIERTYTRATPNGPVDASYLGCAPEGTKPDVKPGPQPAPAPEEARCSTTPAGAGLAALVLAAVGLRRRRAGAR